jgi:hypothetical protein
MSIKEQIIIWLNYYLNKSTLTMKYKKYQVGFDYFDI